MMNACRQYMVAIAETLQLSDGATRPYRYLPDNPAGNVFFEDLPLDFLKDHDFAMALLPLQDRSKPLGKAIARVRNAEKTAYVTTRRRFTREILFRCLIYAPQWSELWGRDGHVGLVDQFNQGTAESRIIASSDNSVIRIYPQDLARPVDSNAEQNKKLRRPWLGISRVLFAGGIQTARTGPPIIPSVDIVPKIL